MLFLDSCARSEAVVNCKYFRSSNRRAKVGLLETYIDFVRGRPPYGWALMGICHLPLQDDSGTTRIEVGVERRPDHRVSAGLYVRNKRKFQQLFLCSLPWDKRKSLPRDSKGFEPIEGYFDRTSSPEDNSKHK